MKIKERSWRRDLGDAKLKSPDCNVYVVVGSGSRAGCIKTIGYRKEMGSPILNVQKTSRGMDISIQAEYRDRGWKLLEDAYNEDPDLEFETPSGKIGMEECRDRFYAFQDNLRGSGKISVDPRFADCIVPGFPDGMLPKYCRELAKGRDPLVGVYDPLSGSKVNRSQEKAADEPKPEPKPRARKSA